METHLNDLQLVQLFQVSEASASEGLVRQLEENPALLNHAIATIREQIISWRRQPPEDKQQNRLGTAVAAYIRHTQAGSQKMESSASQLAARILLEVSQNRADSSRIANAAAQLGEASMAGTRLLLSAEIQAKTTLGQAYIHLDEEKDVRILRAVNCFPKQMAVTRRNGYAYDAVQQERNIKQLMSFFIDNESSVVASWPLQSAAQERGVQVPLTDVQRAFQVRWADLSQQQRDAYFPTIQMEGPPLTPQLLDDHPDCLLVPADVEGIRLMGCEVLDGRVTTERGEVVRPSQLRSWYDADADIQLKYRGNTLASNASEWTLLIRGSNRIVGLPPLLAGVDPDSEAQSARAISRERGAASFSSKPYVEGLTILYEAYKVDESIADMMCLNLDPASRRVALRMLDFQPKDLHAKNIGLVRNWTEAQLPYADARYTIRLPGDASLSDHKVSFDGLLELFAAGQMQPDVRVTVSGAVEHEERRWDDCSELHQLISWKLVFFDTEHCMHSSNWLMNHRQGQEELMRQIAPLRFDLMYSEWGDGPLEIEELQELAYVGEKEVQALKWMLRLDGSVYRRIAEPKDRKLVLQYMLYLTRFWHRDHRFFLRDIASETKAFIDAYAEVAQGQTGIWPILQKAGIEARERADQERLLRQLCPRYSPAQIFSYIERIEKRAEYCAFALKLKRLVGESTVWKPSLVIRVKELLLGEQSILCETQRKAVQDAYDTQGAAGLQTWVEDNEATPWELAQYMYPTLGLSIRMRPGNGTIGNFRDPLNTVEFTPEDAELQQEWERAQEQARVSGARLIDGKDWYQAILRYL